jgi:phosphoribosylanthranilate isomerase
MKSLITKIASKYDIKISFKKNGQLTKASLSIFKDKVNWGCISSSQKLSEEFIREFKDKVDWDWISTYQKLSEEFIKEFKDEVNWHHISAHQKLSEEFIREFKDKVYWDCISRDQKLSEEFIKEFKDEVNWICISRDQKLSEEFIREFKDKVYWDCISKYQKLSEELIREFKDKVYWNCISTYQKLTEEFIREFNLTKPKDSWLYSPIKEKLKYIKENTEYELVDNDTAIIAYKSVRNDYHSVYNFQYQYLPGNSYSCHCDHTLTNQDSFGLSAWTEEGAKSYYDKGKILKVKILIKDIGAIVHDNKKIRCQRLVVI